MHDSDQTADNPVDITSSSHTTYSEVLVLIPSHSLEDFPTELPEHDAASLLNAFAVAWHPALLAATGLLPIWHRSDEPPEEFDGRLIFVPTACDECVPPDWIEEACGNGAVVIAGLAERPEMLDAALGAVDCCPDHLDPDLVADFLALGTCYLQIELLARHMHHYGGADDVRLQRDAIAGAKAVLAHDAVTAREHLRVCFEKLTEARERFYAVDCYIIDLCLLIPRLADEHLEKHLVGSVPVNYLLSAHDLQEIATEKPELVGLMREAWERRVADFAGGELDESPMPLLPLESVLWNFQQGRAAFQDRLKREPTTWGRHRYGLSTALPQILKKFGYHSALHILLDDGLYPCQEESKIRWEGCDGTVIDAVTHIPLPADSALCYLRFPMRLAEAMQDYQAAAAAVILARWPEVKTPWFEDFRRIHAYSPALGRFVTFDDFFDHTDTPGPISSYEAKEYLAPFLTQSVALEQPNPISRYAAHFLRRQQFDAADWHAVVAGLLTGRTVEESRNEAVERAVEQAGPEAKPEAVVAAEALLGEFDAAACRKLADVVMSGGGDRPGYLITNSLAFPRRVVVDLPDSSPAPEVGGPVKAVQFDDRRKAIVVDVPGAGFAWIPAASAPSSRAKASIAEGNLLRNEFFEVHISDVTGGLQRIKNHGRSPNRLSQQLAFRFPRERTVTIGQGDDAEVEQTWYSEMRRKTSQVVCDGPAMGEIVTTGDVVDQGDGSVLATFRQAVRVWRGRPIIEVDIGLEVERLPEGDPWSNYYAARFAWNDSTAAFTRSVLEGAQSMAGQRVEGPHYLEIATEEQRTTILPLGLPFHRKTGPRMVDTILVAAGETQRRFRFVIAVDQPFPMQAALDAMTPVSCVPTSAGPPRVGESGWFFHVDSRNVQLTRLLPLLGQPVSAEPWERYDYEEPPAGDGFAVRLVETEGQRKSVRLRCFRTPTSARQRDFQGRTVADLTIEGDSVIIEMTAYEIADVELRFGD